MENLPQKSVLQQTFDRLKGRVHHTPIFRSSQLNGISRAEMIFKAENLQRMGAFKMRGALNAILSLSEVERTKGVVTHSSGNFAQAVALASRLTGIQAYIVMPENAPVVKQNAVAGYGGMIFPSGNSPAERENRAEEIKEETGATFLHPSNQIEVILGNSTAAIEFIDDNPEMDFLVVPVGGGGLIAGTALAAHYFGKDIQVFGAEPSGADDAFRSLREGFIVPSENPETICDGLRTELGDVNFPIIRTLVTDILRVNDIVTLQAQKLIMERMKLVVEPSAAITLGAVLSYPELFAGKRVGLLLSGGNVDLSLMFPSTGS